MEELDSKELTMLLIVAVFIAIGIIYTIAFVTPMYTSSTSLVLATSQNSSKTNTITTTDITLNSNLVSTYSEIVKSKKVVRQVISNLGIDIEEEDLRENITVSSVEDTELIEICLYS